MNVLNGLKYKIWNEVRCMNHEQALVLHKSSQNILYCCFLEKNKKKTSACAKDGYFQKNFAYLADSMSSRQQFIVCQLGTKSSIHFSAG